jgi:alkylation response protein AidB-like acyl-CoA dehydrogenase
MAEHDAIVVGAAHNRRAFMAYCDRLRRARVRIGGAGDRWLRPALRCELHDAYAVAGEQTGSDPSGIRARGRRGDGGWVMARGSARA